MKIYDNYSVAHIIAGMRFIRKFFIHINLQRKLIVCLLRSVHLLNDLFEMSNWIRILLLELMQITQGLVVFSSGLLLLFVPVLLLNN